MLQVSRTSKLAILAEDYGTTTHQLLEDAMMDGECPGICSRPGCNYTTEVEPEQGSTCTQSDIPEDRMFHPGRVVATPEAFRTIRRSSKDLRDFLTRHLNGDWGEVSEWVKEANNQALCDGGSLRSMYYTPGGDAIWVITEADHSLTTLLCPWE